MLYQALLIKLSAIPSNNGSSSSRLISYVWLGLPLFSSINLESSLSFKLITPVTSFDHESVSFVVYGRGSWIPNGFFKGFIY